MSATKSSSVSVSVIIVLFGLFLAGLALFFAKGTWTYVQASVPTQGTVVGLKKVLSRKGASVTYAPTFIFKDGAGHSYSVTSRTSSKPAAFSVGEAVTVLYRPDDPQHAKINSFRELWMMDLIFGSVGALLSLVGLWGVFSRRVGTSVGSVALNDGSGITRI